jgi:hypothetical protein
MEQITYTTTTDEQRASIAIRVPVVAQNTVITIEQTFELAKAEENKKRIAELERKIDQTEINLKILQIERDFLKNCYPNSQ